MAIKAPKPLGYYLSSKKKQVNGEVKMTKTTVRQKTLSESYYLDSPLAVALFVLFVRHPFFRSANCCRRAL